MITQEAVQAEISYRLERAHDAALVSEARKANHQHRTRLRRWLTRSPERPTMPRTTPALP